jgi:alkane 1-monooxygenase
MDPRVLAHFDGDLSRANLHPRRRDRILAKYPPPGAAGGTGAAAGTAGVPAASSTTVAAEEVLAASCPGCGYTYRVEEGDEPEGFPAGTAWADVPDDWCCPDCGVREKVDFVPATGAAA